MTGFAAVEGSFDDDLAFTLTLKSVNHRFLDLHLRLPAGSDALEPEIRRILKDAIERGHIEVIFDLSRATAIGQRINFDLLAKLVSELRASAARLGVTSEPDLNALLRIPGVLTSDARSSRLDWPALAPVLFASLARAVAEMNAIREREGAHLVEELRAGMHRLRAASETVTTLRGRVRQALFERLRARLQDLLAGVSVSEDRLLAEAALLVEKSDVEEEAVRLCAHIDRFLTILDEGGPVGKRLDFLLQELNREANTTLSKTGSAAGPDSLEITNLGLEMKTEIERAREQVQNLE